MKNYYNLLLFLLLFSSSNLLLAQDQYYYAFGEKVFIRANTNKILVKYEKENRKMEMLGKIKSIELSPLLVEVIVSNKEEKNKLINSLRKDLEIYSCHPFYTLKDGLEVGISDEILVSFYSNVSIDVRKRVFEKFKLEVVKSTEIYQKLRVAKQSDALKIANDIYETGLVEFSTPNFISHCEINQVIPNDTYFRNQITLHNIGQVFCDGHSGKVDADIDAPEAWEITQGSSSIVIAVLDEGVTSDHPDLPNARQVRLNGSNFADGNANDPSPLGNNNHGNACAGVIAATMNNNEGIVGVAPKCKIMPIKIFDSDGLGITPELIADAIKFAVDKGANILSNSWGYRTSNSNAFPVIVSAIKYALKRNCVVVFAAGNTANHIGGMSGYVSFPANANIANLITVGASDRNDKQANYSPSSSLLDVVAPSHRAYPSQIEGETFEMWSIDIPGNTGYNKWHGTVTPPYVGETLPSSGKNYLSYTARFGGTSHSCPVVAGVAALILSVKPYSTPKEVKRIIIGTAEKVGGVTYSSEKCKEMGYGRVNAYAAVVKALETSMAISGPASICDQEATYTVEGLPSGAAVHWNVSNSNLILISGQGAKEATFRKNGNGKCNIIAKVEYKGVLKKLSMSDIWVDPTIGSYSISLNTIGGTEQYYTNQSYYLYSIPNDDIELPPSFFPEENALTSFRWTIKKKNNSCGYYEDEDYCYTIPIDDFVYHNYVLECGEVNFQTPGRYKIELEISLNLCGGNVRSFPLFINVSEKGEDWGDMSYFISPNGDGINETWEITTTEKLEVETEESRSIENFVPVYNVTVFNKKGAIVYQKSNYMQDIERFHGVGNAGGYKDRALPDGVYFYSISGSIADSGHLYLKRE